MSDRALTRRRALRLAGGIAAAGIAGCFRRSGPGGADEPTPTAGGGDGTGEPTPTGVEEVDAVALRPVVTDLQAPLDLADPPGDDRLLVATRPGVVYAVGPGGAAEPFLDLRDRLVTGGERGLLGLALHPGYEENGRLYVRYSAPRQPGTPSSYDHTFRLSVFETAGGGADPGSERVLLSIPQPQSNHNAGAIAFGPDGLLYVAVGDGGAAADRGLGHVDDWYGENPGGNGQDVTDNLLGSILRIDVDGSSADRPYGIPDDNPLVGSVGLDEHYAWGFRNPWRMSWNEGELFVGDVGQDAFEEVDLVERGGNYGWNVREGSHCFGTDPCPGETADGEPLVDPIIEYPHSGAPVSGISVIGGYVYGGDELPGLAGRYLFGDLRVAGRLFVAARPEGGGQWPTGTLPIVDGDRDRLSRLLSFGRDRDGRLYVLGIGEGGGGVYELRPGG